MKSEKRTLQRVSTAMLIRGVPAILDVIDGGCVNPLPERAKVNLKRFAIKMIEELEYRALHLEKKESLRAGTK